MHPRPTFHTPPHPTQIRLRTFANSASHAIAASGTRRRLRVTAGSTRSRNCSAVTSRATRRHARAAAGVGRSRPPSTAETYVSSSAGRTLADSAVAALPPPPLLRSGRHAAYDPGNASSGVHENA
eukprot:350217-Chlamydomonas_euryale.AAC.4